MSNFPPLPRGISATYTASEMFEFAEKTYALRAKSVYAAGRGALDEADVYRSFASENRMREAQRRSDRELWESGSYK